MSKTNGYDIIGDIHGHYDELIILIEKMGYIKQDNIYIHPENRLLVFVGDLIDRGPKIYETVMFVKKMVENNKALCISGNHEYNSVNFNILRKDGNGYYRKHSRANIIQHYATIKSFQNKDKEWEECLEWFQSLPIILEMDTFRVVHAAYHPEILSLVSISKKIMTNHNKLIYESGREGELYHKGNLISNIVDTVLKGIEVPLPVGMSFIDKDGNNRIKSRVKWWLSPENISYDVYLEPCAGSQINLKNIPVDLSLIDSLFLKGYPESEKPIFFGHYWLQMKEEDGPDVQSSNVCCLDYSVAKKGHLVAYRFDNETQLDKNKFVYVHSLGDI